MFLVNYTDLHTNNMLQHRKIYMKYQVDHLNHNRSLHIHEGYEIYFFHKGMAKYIINDNVFNLCPGDMLLFNGNSLHRPNPDTSGPYIRSFINFMPDWIQPYLSKREFEQILNLFHEKKATKIQWSYHQIELLKHSFKLIQKEFASEEFGSESMIKALLIRLIIEILRKLDEDKTFDNQKLSNLKEQHVQRILEVINIRYRDHLSLDHFSEILHLNKYHMCHCFKEVTGLTINHYLATKRIEEAKKILTRTEESVSDVAFNVGFNTLVHFSRQFKKHTGRSPNQFRKQFIESEIPLAPEK